MDNPVTSENPNKPISTVNAKVIYILYLVSIAIGLTGLVGVIMAHIYKGNLENPIWLNSHYAFQQYTFYYGLIYLVLGFLFAPILIGWLFILWWLVWMIIRVVKGLNALDRQQPVTQPHAFFGFGFKN